MVYADCSEAVWVAARATSLNPDVQAERREERLREEARMSDAALRRRQEERAASNRARAIRRARTKMRRSAVANRMVYLWTLTYAVEPATRDAVIRDIQRFFKRLARELGKTVNRIAVVETGDLNGRLHVHFVTDSRLDWTMMGRVWGHGYVLYRDYTKRHGKGAAAARKAAGYCAKYAGKALEDGHGRQAYLISEGLDVGKRHTRFLDSSEALAFAVMVLGGDADAVLSFSDDWDGHEGPPAWYFSVP